MGHSLLLVQESFTSCISRAAECLDQEDLDYCFNDRCTRNSGTWRWPCLACGTAQLQVGVAVGTCFSAISIFTLARPSFKTTPAWAHFSGLHLTAHLGFSSLFTPFTCNVLGHGGGNRQLRLPLAMTLRTGALFRHGLSLNYN